MSSPRALIIGGTGPSGPHLVQGMLDRGYDVTVFHTGRHEIDEAPEVPHLHGDPFSEEGIAETLADRTFDVAVATYGRVRALAHHLVGRCDHFLAVGGVPVYEGYVHPSDLHPTGMQLPVREQRHPLVPAESDNRGGYRTAPIRRAEDEVFRLASGGGFRATYLRYPTIYGPRNPHPWEWSVVQRVRDGRPWMLVPDDGRSVHSRAGARNAAQAILVAVDRPDVAGGKAYNVADDDLLSIRQWAEVVAEHAGGGLEIRSFPGDIASPGWALIAFRYQLTPHCILDTTRIRHELGYEDALPAREGLAETVEWMLDNEAYLRAHPHLTDPFDYAAEDRLVAAYERCQEQLRELARPFESTVAPMPTPQTAKGASSGESNVPAANRPAEPTS